MAATHTLTVYQGATLRKVFRLRDSAGLPIDITGATLRSQARRSVGATTTIFDLTLGSGLTILDPADGEFEMLISDTDTAAMSNSGVWDLEIQFASGDVTRLLSGKMVLSLEVTR